ncbi:MAG TPA: SPOR domain-containing protein [Gemmatimonadaceae bacterium]|nr:SPOR domain-containing protein [Gemmatimonadaceae bacterium]
MERDTERERVQHAWEEVGASVAAALDGRSAVVVIGDDPEAAAAVALGAGRAQGARRRVAIGDLVGEVAPLQALVTGDDPHGLVDSFLYGVSLNKIARPAQGMRNLYILPSGTEPVVAEEIFRNERWRRLAIGFSEVGALLLLVAPAGAPGVDALVAQLDGALVVDAATHVPAGVNVIATAEAPAELVAARAAAADVAERAAVAEAPFVGEPAPNDAVALETAPAELEGGDLAVRHGAWDDESLAAPVESTNVETEVPLAVAATADVGPTMHEEATPIVADAPAPPPVDAAADVAGTASPAADESLADDEPRDARWIRRVVAAPPTQVHIGAQPFEAERRDGVGIESPRRQRALWIVPAAAAALVLLIGLGALFTRGDRSDTRTESGRRAGGNATAARAASDSVAAPNAGVADSLAAANTAAANSAAAGVAATTPSQPTAAAAGGEVAPTPAAGAGAAPAVHPAAPALVVANPADSATASSYAVQIVAANTLEGAKAKQRETASGLPAAVVSPMALAPDNTRWFRLTVGAFPTRADAASYAARLHARFKLDVDPGNVVNVPYALLLEDKVPRARVPARVAAFAARGLPAYALLQADGTARVYAGAFETPQQASLLASALTVTDITPVVVFRTGRAL